MSEQDISNIYETQFKPAYANGNFSTARRLCFEKREIINMMNDKETTRMLAYEEELENKIDTQERLSLSNLEKELPIWQKDMKGLNKFMRWLDTK